MQKKGILDAGFSGSMQKKMDQQCHCEGAEGDCGNLNSVIPSADQESNKKSLRGGRRPTRQSQNQFCNLKYAF